ncbi:MAG: hypothetical protein HZA22_04480 [Nitrospirae bacterium]|nr:hypothetical protein [Nitrospirota bacterium]MBI5695079.1 hypothetical protein [Nitrospirota bacterium]
MKGNEATVEVFFSAIKGLTKKQRSELFGRMSQDPAMREDILDLALIEQSRADKGRDIDWSDFKAKRISAKL